MQSISRNIRAFSIRTLIDQALRKLPKVNPATALSTLLKNKDWKSKVLEVWQTYLEPAGESKEAGTRDLLLAAVILILAQTLHATTPQELISKIEASPKQEQMVSDSQIINKIEQLLPYPVNKAELALLDQRNIFKKGNPPLIGLERFKKTLSEKVEKAMKNEVLPAVQKDPTLSSISQDTLLECAMKAFRKKINDPQYAEAKTVLDKYLGDIGQTQVLVDNIVKQALQSSVALR